MATTVTAETEAVAGSGAAIAMVIIEAANTVTNPGWKTAPNARELLPEAEDCRSSAMGSPSYTGRSIYQCVPSSSANPAILLVRHDGTIVRLFEKKDLPADLPEELAAGGAAGRT